MLHSLQACRAAAAILVVLYHTSHGIFVLEKYFGHKPFGLVFDFGFAGVDFFFVLSGFIMMHVHARDIGQPRALSAYLWKRFSRIYPAYWVVLAIVLPVFLLIPHFGYAYQREPEVIVRSIFLFPHPENHIVWGIAWTLVYEVFFYLLFGVLLLHQRAGILMFAAWTAGIAAFPWMEGTLSPFVFSNMNLRFLAGIGVAMVLQRWKLPRPRLIACAGAAVFLGTGLLEAYLGPFSPWTQCAGYTIGSALTLAGVVQAERSGMLQPPRWLVYLGVASYSIYLIHFAALSIIAKGARWSQLDLYVPGTLLFCLHAAGAIAMGCMFHHTVEKPIHTWAKRFFRRTEVKETVIEEPIRQAA